MTKKKINLKSLIKFQRENIKPDEPKTDNTDNTENTQPEELKIHKYRGLGILSLCAMLVIAGIYSFGGLSIVETSSTAEPRELPIYSVETDKNQVALSFDAAWAAYRLRD